MTFTRKQFFQAIAGVATALTGALKSRPPLPPVGKGVPHGVRFVVDEAVPPNQIMFINEKLWRMPTQHYRSANHRKFQS